MRQVQLHEEERHFAPLVAEAEAGESLTILRHGKPVAQIIPFPAHSERPTKEEHLAALDRLRTIRNRGLNLGGVWNGRDELYDRD